jgi:hypothetical protein
VEDDIVETPTVEGKLLLTEEEWVEKNKKKEAEGSCARSSGARGGRGHGGGNRGRGRGRGGRRGDGIGSSGRCRNGNNGNCHRCDKPGHWAHECRSKQPKKDEQVYMAQEEESSLLLAQIDHIVPLVSDESNWNPTGGDLTGGAEERHGGPAGWDKGAGGMDVVSSDAQVPAGAPIKEAPAKEEQGVIGKPGNEEELVHIVEEKVYATLGGASDKDPHQWVLDTGASNHMMGSRTTFASI